MDIPSINSIFQLSPGECFFSSILPQKSSVHSTTYEKSSKACAGRYFEWQKRQEKELDNEDIKKRERCVARRYKVMSSIIAVVI